MKTGKYERSKEMTLHDLAVETAEKQAASEAEAFEQATSCIVPPREYV